MICFQIFKLFLVYFWTFFLLSRDFIFFKFVNCFDFLTKKRLILLYKFLNFFTQIVIFFSNLWDMCTLFNFRELFKMYELFLNVWTLFELLNSFEFVNLTFWILQKKIELVTFFKLMDFSEFVNFSQIREHFFVIFAFFSKIQWETVNLELSNQRTRENRRLNVGSPSGP